MLRDSLNYYYGGGLYSMKKILSIQSKLTKIMYLDKLNYKKPQSPNGQKEKEI